jgi:Fe-S cluster assembly iron-binding protein IscA
MEGAAVKTTITHPGCSNVIYVVNLDPKGRLGIRTREEFDAEVARLVTQGRESGAGVRIKEE